MGSSPNIPVLIGSNIDVMSDEAGRTHSPLSLLLT